MKDIEGQKAFKCFNPHNRFFNAIIYHGFKTFNNNTPYPVLMLALQCGLLYSCIHRLTLYNNKLF